MYHTLLILYWANNITTYHKINDFDNKSNQTCTNINNNKRQPKLHQKAVSDKYLFNIKLQQKRNMLLNFCYLYV